MTNSLFSPALLTSSVSGMHAVRNFRALHGMNRRRSTRIGQRVNQGIWYKRKVIKSCLLKSFSFPPSTAMEGTKDLAFLEGSFSSARVVPCPRQLARHEDAASPKQVAQGHGGGCTAGGTRLMPCAASSIQQAVGISRTRSADDDTARVHARLPGRRIWENFAPSICNVRRPC
ncbi:hypothetical protein IWX90DRAFT_305467 [Phyllosticta citrichinensis]|uniref:Uncharacterized protein n=1 Tax=Phyllosticta citrichinensis TaxID=1130410 RepID=A0ABR1XLE6_9PEZI